MRESEPKIGWKRGLCNLLIGVLVGVALVETVSFVRENIGETNRTKGTIHEGTTG